LERLRQRCDRTNGGNGHQSIHPFGQESVASES